MSTIAITLLVLLTAAIIYFYDDFKTWKSKAENLHKGFTDFLKILGRKIRNFKNPWTNITLIRDKNSGSKNYGSKDYGYAEEKPQTRAGADIKKMVEQIRNDRNSSKSRIKKSKDGQEITNDERNFLWEGFTLRKRVPCINCQVEDMYEGPQGGMSTNWRCPNCGQGVNLTFLGNGINMFKAENIGIDRSWIRNENGTIKGY